MVEPGVYVPVSVMGVPFAVRVIVEDELVPSSVPPVAIVILPLESAGLLAPVTSLEVADPDRLIVVVFVFATVISPTMFTVRSCVPDG